MGNLSQIVPPSPPPDFPPVSYQFHTFFTHFPQRIFANSPPFPIPPPPPIVPPLFHFPPFSFTSAGSWRIRLRLTPMPDTPGSGGGSEGGWVGGFAWVSPDIVESASTPLAGGVRSCGGVGGWYSVDRQRHSWAEAHCDTWRCCHFMSMGNVGGRPTSVTPPPLPLRVYGGVVRGRVCGGAIIPRRLTPPPPRGIWVGGCPVWARECPVPRAPFNNSAPHRGAVGSHTTHPSPPPPRPSKYWAKFPSGPSADQTFSLAPSAPIRLDQKFPSAPSAPPKTPHHRRGGGWTPPPPDPPTHTPVTQALPVPPPPPQRVCICLFFN